MGAALPRRPHELREVHARFARIGSAPCCARNLRRKRCLNYSFLRLNRTQLLLVHLLRGKETRVMHLGNKKKLAGATGYILLWLLGIPIPLLFLIFLLRGCT